MIPPLPFGHRLSISAPAPIRVQKWRRFGAVLYKPSGCALARLELHEGLEKSRRGEAARKVIRLSDCVRVADASGEASSPRDTGAFFVETKDRLYLLAAPTAERGDWLQAICLLAFPVSCPGTRKGHGGVQEWGQPILAVGRCYKGQGQDAGGDSLVGDNPKPDADRGSRLSVP